MQCEDEEQNLHISEQESRSKNCVVSQKYSLGLSGVA